MSVDFEAAKIHFFVIVTNSIYDSWLRLVDCSLKKCIFAAAFRNSESIALYNETKSAP